VTTDSVALSYAYAIGPRHGPSSLTLKNHMTKQQLIEAVSTKTGHGKADVDAIVEATLATIADKLQSSERVDLRGFGSFVVKEKKARQGRNPRTGETIQIAAKRDAGFKPGKELTEKLGQVQAKSAANSSSE
jgi:nucleoid DNA-binding protein